MSNGLAIAAVTETLRKVLETGLSADLPNADAFTAKPPDLGQFGFGRSAARRHDRARQPRQRC